MKAQNQKLAALAWPQVDRWRQAQLPFRPGPLLWRCPDPLTGPSLTDFKNAPNLFWGTREKRNFGSVAGSTRMEAKVCTGKRGEQLPNGITRFPVRGQAARSPHSAGRRAARQPLPCPAATGTGTLKRMSVTAPYTPAHCWWDCKRVQPPCKTVW